VSASARAFRRASLVIALAGGACARDARAPVDDLVTRAPLADRQSAWDIVLFGTPQAEPVERRGFVRTPAVAGDSLSLAQREAEARLSWTAPANRVAILDVAPAAGLRAQAATVRLNDQVVGRLALTPGRRRYRLALPAEAQRAGENVLTFRFGDVAAAAAAGGERVAAVFYGLAVGSEGDRALEDLLGTDAPPPVSIAESGSVVQVGPSILGYGLRLPPEAELRFTPRLHRAARAAGGWADLGVWLEDEAGTEREVWHGRVDGRERPREVRVALPGPRGQIFRLGLRVAGQSSRRFAWAVWEGLRVHGRPEVVPAARTDAGLDDLRRSLAGASVLLVVLDAAGARHFHGYGYPRETTPEIDRIASEGVLFERAFTPAVFTLAAMSSVWTGLLPDQNHRGVAYDAPLPAGPPTLAERLTARGIHAAGFVANGMAGASFGLDRGFAEFHEIYRDHGPRADAFLEVLPPFFRANKERRFFAYAHFREPHFPYDPPSPFDTRFGPDGPLTADERRSAVWYTAVNARKTLRTPPQEAHLVRLYDGNLAYADHVIGALRRRLEEEGLWDRMVVIVSADHGEALLEHGFISHGQQVYEESTWIPLVIRFPQGPRGRRVTSFVDLVDLAPTIADIFGLAGPDGAVPGFTRRSLLPLLFGAPGKDVVFSRSVGEKPQYALRDERFRFVFNTRYGQEELYDVGQDPAEQRDVARTRPVVAAYYRQALAWWIRGLERGAERREVKPELPSEVVENLKALGYVR
jgi:arylsulfatase A-like enzyme